MVFIMNTCREEAKEDEKDWLPAGSNNYHQSPPHQRRSRTSSWSSGDTINGQGTGGRHNNNNNNNNGARGGGGGRGGGGRGRAPTRSRSYAAAQSSSSHNNGPSYLQSPRQQPQYQQHQQQQQQRGVRRYHSSENSFHSPRKQSHDALHPPPFPMPSPRQRLRSADHVLMSPARTKSMDKNFIGFSPHSNNHNNNNNHKGRGGGGQGAGGFRSKHHAQVEVEVELLESTGSGANAAEQSVIRVSMQMFMARRMKHLNPPPNSEHWTPHDRCRWSAEDRIQEIEKAMSEYFDYKPLQVNDETRWKPRVQQQYSSIVMSEEEEAQNEAEKLGKAKAILNKLSWTTLDKMTIQYLEELGAVNLMSFNDDSSVMTEVSSIASELNDQNSQHATGISEKLIKQSMSLVVDKAMSEPHFAELYASFSTKITEAYPAFRRVLLDLCQKQFDETDKELLVEIKREKEKQAQSLMADEEHRKVLTLKKKSIGLMRFIGELYKNKMIKGRTMVGCLQRLLQPDDEEKLECFAQLMTTIGARLHYAIEQGSKTSADAVAASKELQLLWQHTYSMAGRRFPEPKQETSDSLKSNGVHHLVAPSSRIKFLFQDLIDLKEHDWTLKRRHKEEKAKTIAEIHEDVAQEEEMARQLSYGQPSFNRSQSFGGPPPSRGGGGAAPMRGESPSTPGRRSVPRAQPMRRTKSDCLGKSDGSGKLEGLGIMQRTFLPLTNSPTSARRIGLPEALRKGVPPIHRSPSESLVDSKIVEYLEPIECGEKMKSLLKGFFRNGDMDEALLSIDELVGLGDEGHAARGAAVVEAGVLLVLEMKQSDVEQFQKLLTFCLEQDKLDEESLAQGLKEPIEFIRDIEIDAPKAGEYLANMIAGWMKQLHREGDYSGALSIEKLLLQHSSPPEKPAEFAVQIIACRGRDVTDNEINAIQRLLEKSKETDEKSIEQVRLWIHEYAP